MKATIVDRTKASVKFVEVSPNEFGGLPQDENVHIACDSGHPQEKFDKALKICYNASNIEVA